MKSKFLVCALVFVGVSHVSAMRIGPWPRPYEGLIEGNSVEHENAKEMVYEALESVGVNNPRDVSVTAFSAQTWPHKRPVTASRYGIMIGLNDDKALLEFTAYQGAVELQNRLIAWRNDKIIMGTSIGYFVGWLSYWIVMDKVQNELDQAEAERHKWTIFGTLIPPIVGLVWAHESSIDNDIRTAQALCRKNKGNIVRHVIEVLERESLRESISDKEKILNEKRKSALQKVLNEQSATVDV